MAANEAGLDRSSSVDGSVVERGNAGEVTGDAPLVDGRDCLAPVGSVVLREVEGCDAEDGTLVGETNGAAVAATVLVGLSVVVTTLKADLRGELGFEDDWF